MKRILLIALLILLACGGCSGDAGGDVSTASPPDETASNETTHSPPAVPAPIPTPDTPELDGKARIMDFKELTAAQLMAEMDAGWNLGNTMDALRSVYGLPTQHETAWGNPVTTPEMIQLLADTGFSTLRIPVTWEPHIGPDYTINAGWLDRVQEIVDYGIDCGLYVIINMHHEEWHFPSVENVEEAEAFLTAVWAQIAARFGGYSEKLIFEGLNEPRMKGTPQEWSGGTEQARAVINKWNLAFVQTIRAGAGHNDKRWLMVPTIAASADETPLKGFVKPRDDKVIVSIHSYTPYNFALNTRALQDTAFDPSNPAHTNDIDAMLKRLDTYFVSKGIPVVIGETGCLNKGNPEDRVNWAGYYSGKAASYGIPCIWWDNGIQQSSTGEAFGIMDRRNAEWWFPEIAEAFINARKQ